MFLIQMAGFSGSGKSTLAKEISKVFNVINIMQNINILNVE
ncbi:MAG: hypothetical protein N4A68_00460 [Maledivibacter sp.]|nr:hypothetical protein [Maledivibacter sp.]